MADIEEIADELYGLPPEEFTAARTRHEKEAKAAGDRDREDEQIDEQEVKGKLPQGTIQVPLVAVTGSLASAAETVGALCAMGAPGAATTVDVGADVSVPNSMSALTAVTTTAIV